MVLYIYQAVLCVIGIQRLLADPRFITEINVTRNREYLHSYRAFIMNLEAQSNLYLWLCIASSYLFQLGFQFVDLSLNIVAIYL